MAMQAAASDATKELQAKDKRIHHLEKKVGQEAARSSDSSLSVCLNMY